MASSPNRSASSSATSPDTPISAAQRLTNFATATNQDVYFFAGPLYYVKTSAFVDAICAKKDKRVNALLFLATPGGDPDSAYRVMRALRRSYTEVTVGIVGQCKSAGTLMAIGAHRIIASTTAEFGPLDLQVRKPDEVYASSSGLDIFQAVAVTSASAFDTFEQWLLKLAEDTGGALSTKTAAELASQMAVGLYQPIMGQIDPHRIGEMQRAINIVQSYVERLGSTTLRPGALPKLLREYPSHSFVIDVEEAETSIFRNIRRMSEEELLIAQLCPNIRHYGPRDTAIFADLETKFPLPTGASGGTTQPSKRGRNGRGVSKSAAGSDGVGSRPSARPRKSVAVPANRKASGSPKRLGARRLNGSTPNS
jgi:hypothetical protein